MNRCLVELAAAGIFAALFAFLFFEGIGYSGRSAYMPTAATGIGLLMCCFWALKSVRMLVAGQAEHFDVKVSDGVRFALISVAGSLYVAGFIWLGFFTSTVIMVPAVTWALGYREPKVIALTTLGFTIVLYVVFRLLLAIPLPREALLKLFGV